MASIVYDRTWFHNARTFIEQGLDPCGTFRDYVMDGTITRANAATQAAGYLEWLIQEDGRYPHGLIDGDENAETLDVADLTTYFLDLLDELGELERTP